MTGLMITIVGAIIPTIISAILAGAFQLHKNEIENKVLTLKLEMAEKLNTYVKEGTLDAEIKELKEMVKDLSTQVRDLERNFDRHK